VAKKAAPIKRVRGLGGEPVGVLAVCMGPANRGGCCQGVCGFRYAGDMWWLG
jgi:hypothetical protein